MYDGNGKRIINFSSELTGSTSCYVGMFSRLGSSALVKNVFLRKPKAISGAYYVGGITGYNDGRIISCTLRYFTGTVRANMRTELTGTNGGGTGIDLMAATSLPGFDSEIWSFPSGQHPVLINAAEY